MMIGLRGEVYGIKKDTWRLAVNRTSPVWYTMRILNPVTHSFTFFFQLVTRK